MTNASATLSQNVLDHLDQSSTWTAPAALYMALLKTASAPGDDATVNAAKELYTPGTNGYTRQGVIFNAWSAYQKTSSAVVTFGAATTDWVTAGWVWIIDASSGHGNIWYQGALDAQKTVENTGSLIFDAGDIILQLA